MKSLIIIDFQNDFCLPSGSLYVKGAENAKKGIIFYMQKNSEKINQIIYLIKKPQFIFIIINIKIN